MLVVELVLSLKFEAEILANSNPLKQQSRPRSILLGFVINVDDGRWGYYSLPKDTDEWLPRFHSAHVYDVGSFPRMYLTSTLPGSPH